MLPRAASCVPGVAWWVIGLPPMVDAVHHGDAVLLRLEVRSADVNKREPPLMVFFHVDRHFRGADDA